MTSVMRDEEVVHDFEGMIGSGIGSLQSFIVPPDVKFARRKFLFRT